MTKAAYEEAIAWAEQTQIPLELECDVQFSADDQLICLHDLTLDRTADASGPAFARTVAELQALDFGSWAVHRPSADQRRLVTLAELLIMVHDARARGVPVGLAIETKHPNPAGSTSKIGSPPCSSRTAGSERARPSGMITFSVPAIERLGTLLPHLERTLLIEHTLGVWADGHLPAGVRLAGVDLALLRHDPGYVARARAHGNAVHVWTANTHADITFCLGLGVAGITTDHPDRVAAALGL